MIPGNYLTEKQKLEEEIRKLKEEARALQEQHRGPALEAILEAMREYDIQPEEVSSAFSRRQRRTASGRAGGSLPPKYRDPATGKTWSGRGRTPRWLVDAQAQGRKREEFLI